MRNIEGNNVFGRGGRRLAVLVLLMLVYSRGFGVLMETKEALISTLDNNYVPGSVVVSSNSSHIAYVTGSPSSMRVSIDGVEGFIYDSVFVKSLLFSPDGKRLAFVARQGSDWVAVVDNKAGQRFDDIRADSLSFSPNGKHLAYFAKRSNDWFAVIDDTINEKDYSIIPAGAQLIWDTRHSLHFIAIDYSNNIYSVTIKLKRPPGQAVPKP